MAILDLSVSHKAAGITLDRLLRARKNGRILYFNVTVIGDHYVHFRVTADLSQEDLVAISLGG